MMKSGRLNGKVAWISGASSGIGEGTARLFAAEGAAVTIADIQGGKGEKLAAEINRAGGKALFVNCDVTKSKQVKQSIDRTIRAFGSLNVLVNNAGFAIVKMLHHMTEADWQLQMDVNVKSMFLAFKYAYPHLRRQRPSYVVNLGSISSFVGQGATPLYTASKGAVLQLSRSIALDYAADGIRCNCVCPGITDTPLLRYHLNKQPDPDAALNQRLRRVPLATALTPQDIAKAILYLSCEDSAGITGTSLVVDAGYLAAAEWDSDSFRELRKKL